jgi:hypothetical protein
MMAVVFAILAGLAGIAQVRLLARGTTRAPNPFSLFARLLLVATVLVLAALAGHLLVAAAGWFAGYALMVAVTYWRLR